ncbi:MAG TPA: ribosome biogenesis GTP-binding protein YihA/YsxC [Burkholderiales bacterium]|nr:ribosome biogenesis GTP-binding protein YihA/YsxC [Burkholderiales bacterium]
MEMHAELRALFQKAVFLASAGRTEDFPHEEVPEIAFLGRSNVGKSSAINAITGRKRLAFAAKAPGRTQTINFYGIDSTVRLVDLPGYGYARVPQSVRAHWEFLVSSYLGGRASLTGAVILMDARHPLTPQDERLFGWVRPMSLRTIVLLTKADKLSRSAAIATRAKVIRQLSEHSDDVLLFSSTTGTGVETARERLAKWLPLERAAAGNKRPPA